MWGVHAEMQTAPLTPYSHEDGKENSRPVVEEMGDLRGVNEAQLHMEKMK